MLGQILKKNYYRFNRTRMSKDFRKPKNFPQFTHFVSIPFIRQQHRQTLGSFQDRIEELFTDNKLKHTLIRTNTDLMHVTLGMLTLNLQESRNKTVQIVKSLENQIFQHLKGLTLTLGDIKYFTFFDKRQKQEYARLFYFDIIQDENIKRLQKATDILIREMIKSEIIDSNQLKSMHIKYDHRTGMYVNQAYHMTLFRIQGLGHDMEFKEVFEKVKEIRNQKDLKIVLDCEFIDISTRGHYDGTNFYMPLCRVNLTEKMIENIGVEEKQQLKVEKVQQESSEVQQLKKE